MTPSHNRGFQYSTVLLAHNKLMDDTMEFATQSS